MIDEKKTDDAHYEDAWKAELAEVVAMLRKLEWSEPNHNDECCDSCGALAYGSRRLPQDHTHYPECELDALLRKHGRGDGADKGD